jgi:signal transduction histidine kinase
MDHFVVLGIVAVAGIALAVVIALRHSRSERPASPLAQVPTRLPAPPAAIPTQPPSATGPTHALASLTAPPTTPDDEMDWLAHAADELHTPLTSLRDQILHLRQHIGDSSRHTLLTVAEQLLAQVEQLDSLIEAWSVTARHTGPHRIASARPVELAALTRTLAARLTTPTDPPCEIVAPAPLWVLMDPQAIERVLTIALTNARQAAPTAIVEVVLREVTQRDRHEICIAVADRRQRIHAPAQDVWETLELDLARVLLEEYGGRLERSPRGGGGAVSTIWLPATLLIRLPGHDASPTFTRLARVA